MVEKKPVHSRSNRRNKKTGNKEMLFFLFCIFAKEKDRESGVLLEISATTKTKEEVPMNMTRERANEIAYLGCISGMSRCCNALAITELTTIEEFLEGNLGMRLVEDIARNLHLKKEEAVEFTRFVFDDVKKALAKMEESRARAEQGVCS